LYPDSPPLWAQEGLPSYSRTPQANLKKTLKERPSDASSSSELKICSIQCHCPNCYFPVVVSVESDSDTSLCIGLQCVHACACPARGAKTGDPVWQTNRTQRENKRRSPRQLMEGEGRLGQQRQTAMRPCQLFLREVNII
jgi:hypothetical protein